MSDIKERLRYEGLQPFTRTEIITEIERLEAERDADRIALQAWHSIFGTTQLSHAHARLDAAEQKAERLEAELANLKQDIARSVQRNTDLLAELAAWERPAE